ncbi:epsin-3 [Pelobates fuscus]|uniref:epsin-3 n=1 Tax=Pelobates fuscus TaxID=191477 RepID=UPI002FE48CF2
MATSSIRRQMKNMVHNYTEAEVKVREATSNDPWGPSTTLMYQVAQMTYNTETFSEVMMMVWRRLNDSGKKWRHVYKALTLLDYLIKNGSNKVYQECQENLIMVQTLKDFQFLDRDGKDQGINIREKAKQIVSLLKDEERLKQERLQAQNTTRRMSQSLSAISSNKKLPCNQAHYNSSPRLQSDLEQARPQSSGEEELQLQLAIAMSKEESEKQVIPSAPDANEEMQLQTALNWSKEEYEKEMRASKTENTLFEDPSNPNNSSVVQKDQDALKKSQTPLVDLFDLFDTPQSLNTANVHGDMFLNTDPILSSGSLFPPTEKTNCNTTANPWDLNTNTSKLKEDYMSQSIVFGSDSTSTMKEQQVTSNSCMELWDHTISDQHIFENSSNKIGLHNQDIIEDQITDSPKKLNSQTPSSFLSPEALSLVNLDSLVTGSSVKNKNPFFSGTSAPSSINPFQHMDQKPSLNQVRAISPAPGLTAIPFTPMSNVHPMSAMSAETILNMKSISSSSFFMPSVNQPLIHFQSSSTSLGHHSFGNFPNNQSLILNPVPTMLPQGVASHTSFASHQDENNPFL